MALERATEFCIEMEIGNAIFEGDALGVIKLVKRNEEDCSCYGQIIEDIKAAFHGRERREFNILKEMIIKLHINYQS